MTHTICISYDFDAVSTWLWAYDSWDMPSRHSRGVYGAEVGAPRLLDLHDTYDIPSTWFVPGHTIDSFPEICGDVWDRGHGIQHHGWSHHSGPEDFSTRDEEEEDFKRAIDSIEDLTGRSPSGYRFPGPFSEHTVDILESNGVTWDSSLMASDFRPHWVYDNWSAPRDGPYEKGEQTSIVELPFSWQRDDWPALTFTWSNPHRMGYVPEDTIFQRWYDQFDWMYEHMDAGVFVLTLHPQVIGQAHRLMRLEDFFQYLQSKPDTRFEKMATVAREWRDGTFSE